MSVCRTATQLQFGGLNNVCYGAMLQRRQIYRGDIVVAGGAEGGAKEEPMNWPAIPVNARLHNAITKGMWGLGSANHCATDLPPPREELRAGTKDGIWSRFYGKASRQIGLAAGGRSIQSPQPINCQAALR